MSRLKFADPATAITDYVLAAESFVFSFLIYRVAGQQVCLLLWSAAFVAVGISALSGGYFHHRRLELSQQTGRVLWKVIAISLFGAVLLFVASGMFASITGFARKAGLFSLALLFAAGLFRVRKPGGESIRSRTSLRILTVGLIVLVLTQIFQWSKQGAPEGNRILAGSILCIIGVLIQQAAPKIHRHFNHDDLCHVFFMIGLLFLYLGGLMLRDKT